MEVQFQNRHRVRHFQTFITLSDRDHYQPYQKQNYALPNYEKQNR